MKKEKIEDSLNYKKTYKIDTFKSKNIFYWESATNKDKQISSDTSKQTH